MLYKTTLATRTVSFFLLSYFSAPEDPYIGKMGRIPDRVAAIVACLFLLFSSGHSFYLPGVAPRDFIRVLIFLLRSKFTVLKLGLLDLIVFCAISRELWYFLVLLMDEDLGFMLSYSVTKWILTDPGAFLLCRVWNLLFQMFWLVVFVYIIGSLVALLSPHFFSNVGILSFGIWYVFDFHWYGCTFCFIVFFWKRSFQGCIMILLTFIFWCWL